MSKIDDIKAELDIIDQFNQSGFTKGLINNPEHFIFDKYKLYYRVNDRYSNDYKC